MTIVEKKKPKKTLRIDFFIIFALPKADVA